MLDWLKNLKSNLNIGNANWVPFVDFGTGSAVRQPQTTSWNNQYNLSPGGPSYDPNVLGATNEIIPTGPPRATMRTGGGGGGGQVAGAAAQAGPQGDNGEANALQRFLAELEGYKRSAQALAEGGKRAYDTTAQGVGDYLKRTKDVFDTSGQEITNSFYENAGDTNRTAQSARTKALQNARVGGYGDSSRLGALNQVTGGLAGNIGSLIARRGENQAENTNLFNQRSDQGNNALMQAKNKLADIESQAGLIQSKGAQDAGFNFSDALGLIRQRQNELASIQAPSTAGVTPYTPNFAGLPNAFANMNAGLAAGSQGPGGGVQMGNFANLPADIKKLILGR